MNARTMQDAIRAKDSYRLVWLDEAGRTVGDYWPPASRSISDTTTWAAAMFEDVAGTTARIERVIGGNGSCLVVEQVGWYTFPTPSLPQQEGTNERTLRLV